MSVVYPLGSVFAKENRPGTLLSRTPIRVSSWEEKVPTNPRQLEPEPSAHITTQTTKR